MVIEDALLTLFHGRVTSSDGAYQIRIPKSEVEMGSLTEDSLYRVAILQAEEGAGSPTASLKERQPTDEEMAARQGPTPPVSEGEHRRVHIKSEGEEGDGVAFIDTGYAVFVPEVQVGDDVEVKIETVHDRYAFAEPVSGRVTGASKTSSR